MPFMQWSDDFNVNVNLIDRQHKKLIDILNRLYDGLRDQRGSEALNEILTELTEYAEAHFTTEERLMNAHNYREYEAHKAEHDLMVQKVKDFQHQVDSGKLRVSVDVMRFLRDWLSSHILTTDKQFSAFFAERGVR